MGKIATEQEAAQIGRVINSNKKIVTVSELKNINCSSVGNYSNSQGVQYKILELISMFIVLFMAEMMM